MAGLYKLNTDGAPVSSTALASCGGVVRNCNGEWSLGFCRFVGICSVLEVELWDVLEDLRLTWDAGFRCIMFG
ncbi:hypothetical protein V6N12_008848 [Hibiscus sabdariffa]|uniref:RNase H type-1 domain-containing protein n=1 Tax=Hibiscus sabdariffa TaxID=183260 RepID=A0ABR2C3Y1_9ROSI